jgi:hypothetical protein
MLFFVPIAQICHDGISIINHFLFVEENGEERSIYFEIPQLIEDGEWQAGLLLFESIEVNFNKLELQITEKPSNCLRLAPHIVIDQDGRYSLLRVHSKLKTIINIYQLLGFTLNAHQKCRLDLK